MAKPDNFFTVVRGTPEEPRNFFFTYVSKLDEVLITEQKTGNTMRFLYSQLEQVMDAATKTREKYNTK